MILTIAFGIILALLFLPILGWLLGVLFVAGVKTLFYLPKTLAVFFIGAFAFYGVFVSTWYVASLMTRDSTQQMTATFLGTFGFFITAAILWGKRQDKKDKPGSGEAAKEEPR